MSSGRSVHGRVVLVTGGSSGIGNSGAARGWWRMSGDARVRGRAEAVVRHSPVGVR
jgi:NAD(P)-dependent dehydrogenase (short-subunit alcohol dehydrogenase family)